MEIEEDICGRRHRFLEETRWRGSDEVGGVYATNES